MKKTMLFLIFFSTLTSKAQLRKSFEKGWIISKNNIKKEGYIKVNDLSKLSSEVCFKRSLEEKKCQNYDNTKIQYFQMAESGIFELLSLKINNNQIEIKKFVNLIIKGEKLSLYRTIYKSELFYILAKDGKNYVLQKDKLFSGSKKVTKYRFEGILNAVTEGLILKNHFNINFDENNFVKIVTQYNKLKNAQSKDLRNKEKSTNYIIVNVGLGFRKKESEYYGQVMHRKYLPSISRSTSLNSGISYFNFQFSSQNKNYTYSLVSIPLQIQQNLFNKNIRPYIFSGVSINYIQLKTNNNSSLLNKGFQKTYGINFLYGAGIEVDIFKGIFLKGEYRNEAYIHPVVFGLGYIFKLK